MCLHRRTAAAVAGLLFAAAGCATAYVPSERVARLRAAMDEAEAPNLFADAFGRTLKGAGLCRAPFGFDDPAPAVSMEGFTLQAWRAGEELGRRLEGGRTLVTFRKDRFAVAARYADLREIGVAGDAGDACATSVPLGQSAVVLRGVGPAFPLVLAVRPDALDALLAAITRIAPGAALVVEAR